jgi:EmrB/QacA subfamily drug resistance transporter
MTDAATKSAARVRQRLLWAAILASFVSFLDGSIVNIALPAIGRDLGGGLVTQQWVIDGYLLTLSALILVAGGVSDRFGRLRVLRIAIVAFSVTSILCGLSPTGGILIGARLAQGVAGALLVPGSLALIIATFEGEEQAKAIGRWTGWTSVSFLAGPIIGGVLVDGLGWRWVFYLSVLPAAAGLVLLGRMRDEQHERSRARFDVPSAVLTAIGLGGITAGLIEQQRLGLTDPLVLGAIVLGVAALVGFVLWDRRAVDPLVPPELFRSRNFSVGNLATLVIYAGLGLSGLVLPVFLQEGLRLTATITALVSLPATVLNIVLSGRFGALAGRYGSRWFMTVGPLLSALGFSLMAFGGGDRSSLAVIVPGVVLYGLGLSVTVAPLTAAVLGAVPEGRSGIGSAVNNAVARVAALVATACAGLITGGTAGNLLGFQRGVLAVAVLLAAGAIISALGIQNPQRQTAS